MQSTFWQVLAAYNGLVFCIYAWDKWMAMRGGRRVAEATLLWLAALAGGPGALLGMILLRHKIRKWRFLVGVPVVLLGQAGVLVWWLRLQA